jgi:hypothetical protein
MVVERAGFILDILAGQEALVRLPGTLQWLAMGETAISFAWPIEGVAAIVLVVLATVVAQSRRVDLAGWAFWSITTGLLLIALACAGPIWHRSNPGRLAVMVDLSSSTRGAAFRDASEVRRRLRELEGDMPYDLFGFAGGNQPIDPAGPWNEMPADETVFSPVPAGAIVLFSDARFALPGASPPVYVVEDPGLEEPDDAAVEDLQIRDRTVSATVRNSGPTRTFSIVEDRRASSTSTASPSPATTQPIANGVKTVERDLSAGTAGVSVEIDPGDLWPENDRLETLVSPPMGSERWWIGDSAAQAGWRTFSPGEIPTAADAFLAPSLIVLNDVPADQISPTALDRLSQYVQDLGGTLLIIGGPHAFSAGGYQGTRLETLSPLASWPPTPMQRWIILVDSSGSMSGDVAPGVSRWKTASDAAVAVLRKLPPADEVEIGQFSDAVAWWSTGKSAKETSELALPPSDAGPHGPTNLEAALNSLAAKSRANVPTDIILISDCDARIDDEAKLAAALRGSHSRLNVLAIGSGEGLPAIQQIAARTAGAVLSQGDPAKWIESARQIVLGALPTLVEKSVVEYEFIGAAKEIPGGQAREWNHLWLKKDADLWATATHDGNSVAMAASWIAGFGRVAATAFSISNGRLNQLAELVAQRPKDPRFSVHWNTRSILQVTVDAVDGKNAMNDLKFSLHLMGAPLPIDLTQTGPGRYMAELPAPRESTVAMLRIGGETIDRIAVAGRYPKEFDAIGNDHEAMRTLAEQTGGAVITPDQHRRIDFHWPKREVGLTGWLAVGGVVLIVAGLLRWGLA